ncbi:MAG: DUF4080 domain-containing protein [Desulfoplanes sp.]|nr:DUF4080 domain-containing protein [Desulfoplanes sp.]MDD4649730.1 DUF4080 domain-containing protein [Desulfoplanes sp.]
MKKICLVALNARYTHSNLALLYLREALGDLPCQTVLKAYTISQNILEILRDLHTQRPDYLAFSVYIWNSENIRLLLPEIKKIMPDTTIILGGPEVSYTPDQWLKDFPQIDYIIQGAGETCLHNLLGHPENYPRQILCEPAPPLDQIPFPYREKDFEELSDHYIYYESSRGCPFNCSYCLSSRMDMQPDYRAVDKVCAELDMICAHTPRIIKFIDRTFNARKRHHLPIWEHLIQKNPPTCFHCELHAGLLTEQDFALLATARKGLFQFEIGIQSTNPQTLAAIHRQTSWELIKKNIRRLIAMGTFHVHVDLIAGLPFEDWDSLQRSFNDVYGLKADALQLGFLKVLPGTEMEEKSIEYGIKYMKSAPYQVLETRWMTFTELCFVQHMETTLDRLWNAHQFTRTIEALTVVYPTPFAFYETFTRFVLACSDMNEKKWPKIADLVVQFIQAKHTDRLAYILDCLRWDWCSLANAQYYPPVLDNGLDHQLREQRKQISQMLTAHGVHLTQSAINNGIMYKAATTEFGETMDKEWAFFIKQGKSRKPLFLASAQEEKV